MTLIAPPDRLTDYNVEILVPQVCSNSITPLGNGLRRLEFVACAGQWLIGTQQLPD